MSCIAVSVVIPTYNHGRWVTSAIQSVLAQTYSDFEVIVVDDGSSDDTRAVVEAWGDRIRYIWQENQGLSAARNTGIVAASGRYIGVLDADDMYEPEFMATLVPRLAEVESADAIYCGYRFVDHLNAPLPQREARVTAPERFYTALLDGNFLVPESMLVRRACYEAVGLFDISLRACEDWDMWLRIAATHNVTCTDEVLTRHRILPGSMSTDPMRMLTSRLAVLNKHVGAEPVDANVGSATQRRAYGRAYLGSTIEYLQAGNLNRAHRSFRRMVQICPELLSELDTFYQLALGDQPKGSLGDFQTLDFDQNFTILSKLLDDVFEQPAINPMCSQYQEEAHANMYLAFGMLSYGARLFPAARSYLKNALLANPRLALRWQVSALWAKSFLDPRWIDRAGETYRRIANTRSRGHGLSG